MIVVKIYGGMANQLFQYAAGYALSLHHAVPLKLDIRSFQTQNEDTKRDFALDLFNIDYEIASQLEIDNLCKFRAFDYALNKMLPTGKKRFYGEKKPGFNASFFDLGADIYLRGYFQSHRYFQDCKPAILSQFNLKAAPRLQQLPFAQELNNENTVALHIRLGDYLNPTLSGIMEPFDLDYYKNSIEFIKSKCTHPKFYVFSDQIELAKDLLQLEASFTFVDQAFSKNAEDDFYFMQSCQHHIMANSTFSWWAAYLNKNPHKIIVAPKKWYKAHFGDTSNLYPSNWITI